MAKKRVQQPHVRKPVLVFGGVAVGVALLAFVLMNFVGGGGSGEAPVTSGSPQAGSTPNVVPPAPAPQEEPGLRAGGRNPFQPVVNLQASAASAPEPAAVAPVPPAEPAAASTDGTPKALIGLQTIHDGLADLMFTNAELKNVTPGTTLQPTPPLPDTYVLERVTGDCAFVKRGVEIRRVCVGETIVL